MSRWTQPLESSQWWRLDVRRLATNLLHRWDTQLSRIASVNPLNNIYAFLRSAIAFAGLITLLFNPTQDLFVQVDSGGSVNCYGVAAMSYYCVMPDLDVARIAAIVLLASIVAGLLPRWTAIPHWWIAFSFQVSSNQIEGGDQIAAITTLLLIPVALQDSRWSHWSNRDVRMNEHGRLIAHFFLTAIRLQAAIIYLASGAAKFGQEQWQDGTAMYYWLNHATFGAPEWQQVVYQPILTNATLVSVITWGVPALEIIVAMALFAGPGVRRVLFVLIALMHVGIAVSLGLVSFAIVMVALDALYLLPMARSKRESANRVQEGIVGSSSDRVARVDV